MIQRCCSLWLKKIPSGYMTFLSYSSLCCQLSRSGVAGCTLDLRSGNFLFHCKVSYIKRCFAGEHRRKEVLLKQTCERCMMLRRHINVIPQTVGAWALVHFAPPGYSSLTDVHACIGSPYIALLSSACGGAIERNLPKNFSVRFLLLPQAGWWALWFLLDWTALAGSHVVTAKWTGLQLLIPVWCFLLNWNCWYPDNENWTCPQRAICKQVYFHTMS